MNFTVRGIDTDWVAAIRKGAPDANGQVALRRSAQGTANPCRHCLRLIKPGELMLVLAHRPFASAQPYAEVGPIFLHAEACLRYDAPTLPGWFGYLNPVLVRGYDHDDWIRYDTAEVIDGAGLAAACGRILAVPGVAYVHIRSKFNCFQCRVDR